MTDRPLEYDAIAASPLVEALATIERVVAAPSTDAHVLADALALTTLPNTWRIKDAVPFWFHLYWLLTARGNRATAAELDAFDARCDPFRTAAQREIRGMRQLAVRVIRLREGESDGAPRTAPTRRLFRFKAELLRQLARCLGAPDWDATDELVPLLERPHVRLTSLLGLHVYAAALLHADGARLASLAPFAPGRPALALLLRCKGVDLADAAPAHTAAELLAAIAAAPDDDAPRAVYGDWLAELDPRDPHAELIRLQLRAVPTRADRHRANAIVRDHFDQLLGPLAPLVTRSAARFRRGFLHTCRLKSATPAQLELLGQAPQTATIERLELASRNAPPLDAASWPALRVVGGLTDAGLASLAGHPRVEAIGLRDRMGDPSALAPLLATLPALRALALASTPGVSPLPAWAARLLAPGPGVRVERLALAADPHLMGPWLEAMRDDPRLLLVEGHETWNWNGLWTHADVRWRLERDDDGRPTRLRLRVDWDFRGYPLDAWPDDAPLTRLIVHPIYGRNPDPSHIQLHGRRVPVEAGGRAWPPLLERP